MAMILLSNGGYLLSLGDEMTMKTENLADIFAQFEAEREAEGRAEMAKDAAQWAALTPEEQEAIRAEREARWETIDTSEEDDYDCDCADKAPIDEYWMCPKCDSQWFPEEDEDK